MTKNYLLIFSLAAFTLLTSCSSTSTLTMGVLEPARVTVPSNVTKVGLINRSLPSESNKTAERLIKYCLWKV